MDATSLLLYSLCSLFIPASLCLPHPSLHHPSLSKVTSNFHCQPWWFSIIRYHTCSLGTIELWCFVHFWNAFGFFLSSSSSASLYLWLIKSSSFHMWVPYTCLPSAVSSPSNILSVVGPLIDLWPPPSTPFLLIAKSGCLWRITSPALCITLLAVDYKVSLLLLAKRWPCDQTQWIPYQDPEYWKEWGK